MTNLTPFELWGLNLIAYDDAIARVEARGDAMKAVELRKALRAIEQRGPRE